MVNSVEAVLQARKIYKDLHQAYPYVKVFKVLEDWLEENKALAYESNLAKAEMNWLYGHPVDSIYLFNVHSLIENENLGVDIEDIRVKVEPIPSDENSEENNLDESLVEIHEDSVNHPSHYQLANGIEAIDLMEMTSTAPEFCGHLRNTALKYIIRAGKKDPRKYIEDLEKAKWYISKLQEYYSKCENNEY